MFYLQFSLAFDEQSWRRLTDADKGWAVINLDLAFFIQIINFGILVLVLNVLLYKPLRAALDRRRQEIDGAKEKTASVDRLVKDKVEQYEAALREARTDVSARRAELVKEALAEESSLLEKARKDAAVSLDAIRQKVVRESEDARALLRKQAEHISDEICEKILGRSL